ncbi:MAG: hypothetical protein J4F43_09595 [Dehalococcoidia bacterium]|nr:hypothetical protein [Dehalococcoidia bacterium]
MVLIDPLLQVLGWDTSEPSLVTPEYNVSGRWADYALLSGGQPAAIIEAKKLDESLESHRMQMLNYSNASGIQYAGLTDGNRWELYEVFKQAPLEERRILDVSIATSPSHRSALQLLLLWRPNLASGQPLPASVPLLSEPTQPVSVSTVPKLAPPDLGQGWASLSEFVAQPGTKAPPHIRFPDGAQHENKFWVDVLAHTVQWLWKRGSLRTDNVPVKSSGKRYIVNTVPQHPGGNHFNAPRQVAGTELSVEANISSQAAIANAKRLLTYCNEDASQVYLQLDN